MKLWQLITKKETLLSVEFWLDYVYSTNKPVSFTDIHKVNREIISCENVTNFKPQKVDSKLISHYYKES